MKRKVFSILFALVLVLSLSLVTAVPAQANGPYDDTYVDDDAGYSDGDGDEFFETIQAAIDNTNPGGTVHVAAGTYDEAVVIDKSLTLISDTGDYRTTGVILNGPIALNNVENVTVQGFNFQDYTPNGYAHVIYTAGTADNITIAANSFDNCEGLNIHIYLLDTWFEDWTITDNKITNVLGTNASGIWIQRLRNSTISYNEISNTTYAGMILDRIENVTVSNNNISNTPKKGIQVATSTDCNVLIENNYITNTNTSHDADEGAITIYPDVTNIQVVGNTLTGNYQGFTVRDKSGAVASDVHVNFNNIYSNDGSGVGNFAQGGGTLDATNNWWGASDGPSHSPGSGDKVSDHVTSYPWLGAPLELPAVHYESIIGTDTPYEVDATDEADTKVTLTVTTDKSETDIYVAKYESQPFPDEPFPDASLGKFIDVSLSNPDAVLWPIHVEVSYTDEEVTAAGIDESSLGLYYYTSPDTFHRCSDTGVDTANNIIWANVTPDEADFLRSPFGGGGSPVGALPVGGEAHAVNKLAVLVPWIGLALILAIGGGILALRRRLAH